MINGTGVLAGIDIGSTKTCAVVAESRPGREPGEPLELLGVGVSRAGGMNGPAITNLEAATRSIREAVQEAERMAGREVDGVYISVPSTYIRTSRSRGVVAVSGAEITPAHVRRVQEVGQAVPIPPDRQLIHAICQEYSVDGRGGIQDPVGMVATRLEADVCVVTAESAVCRDLAKVVDRAGYRAGEFVIAPLASGLSLLDDGDRDAGVALIEIGGAATDVLVYGGKRLLHVATMPWGGAAVTRDVARGLGVPEEEAGRLKERHGSARRSSVDPEEQLEVSGPSTGAGRRVSRELLAHIIEQRLDEILGLVYEELDEAGVRDRLGAGIVLAGGGVCTPQTVELARSVFNLPVRLGVPGAGLAGATNAVASPVFATGVGLAMYGSMQRSSGGIAGATRAIARVGGWIRDFF